LPRIANFLAHFNESEGFGICKHAIMKKTKTKTKQKQKQNKTKQNK